MKKTLLFFAGLCLCVLAGCSGEETPKKLELSQNSFELYAGDEITFSANQAVQFTSENTFIAYASEAENKNDKHVLKGLHVGETIITVSTDSESITCPVKVIPRYDTFIEPAYSLLKKPLDSLDELFAADTREIMRKDDNKVILYGEKPGVEAVSYTFNYENNKYTISGISAVLSLDYKDEVYNFLYERYFSIHGDEEVPDFIHPDRNYKVILITIDESLYIQYI